MKARDDTCTLEQVAWPMRANLSKVAHELALVHQSRCRLLEAFDEESGGWLKECEDALVNDISNLECELR